MSAEEHMAMSWPESTDGSGAGLAAGVPAPPVFVLCGGRSGSTLLRFLLDAHPDLACPPETNLPVMAGQLATVWSLIAGAPLAKERGDEPPVIPDEAISGVRRTLDEMTGSYLARRGRKRYCDKSLGTARFTELLLRVYPEARFLCLYRHPMDVIASGIEACPWGLNGYGFDSYIAGTPGNAVWALARFWMDNVAAILAAEERFAPSCHRVRYEDLVADPEEVARGIFDFLGVAPAPGISTRCFTPERERFGPADYKIWYTSKISADSVGRGWSVPVGMIPPPALEQVNELAGKLGYVPIDEKWGTAVIPADLRVTEAASRTASPAASPVAVAPGRREDLVGQHITAALARVDERFLTRWAPCVAESFTIAALPATGDGPAGVRQWRVEPGSRHVSPQYPDADDDTDWDVVGSAEAWTSVLTGRMNLGVALRRCELRYCDADEASRAGPVAADIRIGMLAELIELGSAVGRAGQAREFQSGESQPGEFQPATGP
jgi:Sulfotransferase family